MLHEHERGHHEHDGAHGGREEHRLAANVVGPVADHGHEEGDEHEHRQREQRPVDLVVAERRRQIGGHVGGQRVADRVGAGDQHDRGGELAPVSAHHVAQAERPLGLHDVALDGGQVGGLLLVVLRLRAAEGRRVLDARAQVQRDRAHRQGEHERDAPSPGGHDVVGQREHEDGDQARTQCVTHVGAPVQQRGVETTLLVRGVLSDEGRGTGVLTTGGEALDQLQGDEQDRRPDAQHRGRRQHTDTKGRHGHHHQGEGQDLLAPQAVTELSEDDAAQRTGDEGHGEDTEREEVLGGV